MTLPAPAFTTTQRPHSPLLLPNQISITTISSTSNIQITHKSSQHRLEDSSFDHLASWTSSIAQHCKKGHLSFAAAEFKRMRIAGIEPNHITFVTLLSGCSRFPALASSFGAAIHGYTIKLALNVNNLMVGTALIDMYAKFGQMGFARLCFELMASTNKVSWNTLIDGYMKNGYFDEAINLFDTMPERDVISRTGFVKKDGFEEATIGGAT